MNKAAVIAVCVSLLGTLQLNAMPAEKSGKITEVLVCNTSIQNISTTSDDHVILAGFAARRKLSTGLTHRELYTYALVIGKAQMDSGTGELVKENGKVKVTDKVCIVTSDLMEVSIATANIFKAEIAKQAGIPVERVFLHCIHTHSAPRSTGSPWAQPGQPNHAYGERLQKDLIANAVKAIGEDNEFKPFYIETGTGSCSINNNRGEKDGPIDRTVFAARFLDAKSGKPFLALVNYACHPVSLGPGSYYTSPDFPALARETVQKAWGCDVFYYSGAQGNVDPVCRPQKDTAVTNKIGVELGESILAIKFKRLPAKNFSGKGLQFKVANGEIKLPFAVEEVTEKAVNDLATEITTRRVEVSPTWKSDVERWRKGVLEDMKAGRVKNYLPIEAGAVNVGGMIMVFSQGEPFNEYQVAVRSAMKSNPVMFIAYTNGQNSYLPSKHAYETPYYAYEKDQMYVYVHSPYPLSSKMPDVYENGMIGMAKAVAGK